LALLGIIINSYHATAGKGIPLGNLTSQLFSNIYLNIFDHYIKRNLKIRHYVRYADDFVILSHSRQYLDRILSDTAFFLSQRLNLVLHDDKVFFRKWHQGIDFLGFVSFPYHRLLRTKTKKRMLWKIREKSDEKRCGNIENFRINQTLQSYLGRLKHCRSQSIQIQILRTACIESFS
jgi:hypothetical protein